MAFDKLREHPGLHLLREPAELGAFVRRELIFSERRRFS